MQQTWRRLTFLHWPCVPDLIGPLIAPVLKLDTFDGSAWLGLVPFEIYGTPGIPYFPETNLRTYVVGPDGGRAVWFFSLEAASLSAVLGARIGYHLPYFWARMRVEAENGAVHYRSRRRWPHHSEAMTDITIEAGPPFELTERDHFLTARYRLYSFAGGRLRCAQIEHPPWPLTRGRLIALRQTLLDQIGLPPPTGAPLVHYADSIAVKIGRLI
jgi:uncharacterized protein YqjF (DUF2071 family)